MTQRKGPAAGEYTVRTHSLGAGGDAAAEVDGATFYVSFALAGETVRIRIDEAGASTLVDVITPSPDRIAPFCPHAGSCGGCRLQHLDAAAYQRFKRDLVVTALARRGIAVPDGLVLVDAHGEGRRRVTLHVVNTGRETIAGFMRASSHTLEAIDLCPATHPALAQMPALARSIADTMRLKPGKRLDVQCTTTETGVDVDVRGARPLSPERNEALAGLASRFGLARLTVEGEPVAIVRTPLITMGRARVAIPPAAFLQATAAGEAALAGFALEALADSRKVMDLFCGVGPFALRLAQTATVHAANSGQGAIASLKAAHAATPGLKPVSTAIRDLFRAPVTARELNGFDAALFDPPRQGAEAQARELAVSGLTTVVAVSCDPGTFARDAAILVSAGFALSRLVAVDQFKWTAHVEIAALFLRPKRKGG